MFLRKLWVKCGLTAVLFLTHSLCAATDSTSFELWSAEKTKMGRLGLQLHWGNQWFRGGSHHLSGYWDTSLSHWQGTQHQGIPGNTQNLNDLGVAAVFRYQRHDKAGFYAEAGTGPHVLSDFYDNNNRRQGSQLVFHSHAGIGFTWKNGVDLGFKALHMSNARLADPNAAVNMVGVGLKYRW